MQLNIRSPQELVDEIDALVEEEKKARPGVGLTRTDMVRELIYEGLRARKAAKTGRAK